jgi:MinD-like ATPase involved in chromosome partitioning or flagellar assembly
MLAIVTFYSFKGGVGRTTALAACAWQLARAGKRVAIIDLDLEAPGIARPDYILLDSRAGLHDLAGLSLHRLAHVDVLIGRAGEQGYRGLDLTLRVLAKRKGPAAMRCIVVHTLAPPQGLPDGIVEEQEFRERSFESFKAHVYDADELRTLDAEAEAMHLPLVIRRNADLDRFASLVAIEPTFFRPDYQALREKIESLCAPLAPQEEP